MMRLLWAVLVWLGLAASAGAAGHAMVRAHLEPAGPVMPGQPVKLVVDAMTSNWFTAAPVYPPLDIPGVIASPPGDDATNFNVEIGGVKWFGISRTYQLTPQSGGTITIPPVVLQLQVGQVGAVKAQTPTLHLTVKVVARPPGAENALGTSRLDIKQTLDRQLVGLKQGDAFTRTVTVSAAGVQAMLLPPTVFGAVNGLSVYPKPPKLQDITKERVGFLGSQRTDAATYVLQQAGDYTLPGVEIAWWDTRGNQLRKATLPALHFSVAAVAAYKPLLALPQEASAPKPDRIKHIDVWTLARQAAYALIGVLIAAWLLPRLWRLLRRLWRAGHSQRQRHTRSEAAAWRRLQRALHGRDRGAMVTALYAWLALAAPGQTAAQAGINLDPAFAAWYGANGGNADIAALRQATHAARKRLRHSPTTATYLPALNP
ncbi:BatD family protein [Silvimonas sp. JCM 19000]